MRKFFIGIFLIANSCHGHTMVQFKLPTQHFPLLVRHLETNPFLNFFLTTVEGQQYEGTVTRLQPLLKKDLIVYGHLKEKPAEVYCEVGLNLNGSIIPGLKIQSLNWEIE